MRIGERIEHNGITAELVDGIGKECPDCCFNYVNGECPHISSNHVPECVISCGIFKEVKPDQPQIRKEEEK